MSMLGSHARWGGHGKHGQRKRCKGGSHKVRIGMVVGKAQTKNIYAAMPGEASMPAEGRAGRAVFRQ